MIEIHKYDTITGNELFWIDDSYFCNDGDIDYFNRYISSLNEYGGKRFYYYHVPIFKVV